MNDLTLVYYTANRIDEPFGSRVLRCLQGAARPLPLVVVSQGQMRYGPFLASVFAELDRAEPSIWQVYRNVLIGAKEATTRYVACCEDDSLYTAEHFAFQPPRDDTFYYNRNRWVITRRLSDDGKSRQAFYYWRERTQMAQCICARELLIETLEEKFAKYPVPPPSTDAAKKAGWGEPGRYERNLGLTRRAREYFDTVQPNVTFNHGQSLMGRRKVNPGDRLTDELPPWGHANDLWNRIHG